MKTIINRIAKAVKRSLRFAAVGVGLAVGAATLLTAAQPGPLATSAYWSYRSFGCTNILTGGTTLTGWPTNVLGWHEQPVRLLEHRSAGVHRRRGHEH